MNDEILFSEKQSFRQWWLWLIILTGDGLSFYWFITHFVFHQDIGNIPPGNTELIFSVGIPLVLTILFLTVRLETQVKKDGIYVRFFPFHLKFRYYSWNAISRVRIREYRPIMEYGGWGIRGLGDNKALNVSGKMGLQIEFNDKRKLLIGTQKPEELEAVIAIIIINMS